MSDLRARVHKRLHNKFGVDALYTPINGTPINVKVKLRVGAVLYGDEVLFSGDEDQVVFLVSDIPDPDREDIFEVNGIQYHLLKKLLNDGSRAVWSVSDVS